MWKNILSLAALVLSVGASAHLIGTANATLGPVVSTGSNPIRSSGGVVPGDGVVNTAPDDQDFIVTGLMTAASSCYIAVGGTVVVPSGSRFAPTYVYSDGGYATPSSLFTQGKATLRVPAGQALSMSCVGSNYYLQGHLVQP